MTVRTDFSDEELTAYLDDERDFAPVAEIEAAARGDARLRARLDALALERGGIKQAFDQLLAKAPKPQLAYAPARAPAARAWMSAGYWQAIVAAVLLTLGAAGGHYLTRPQLAGWRDYVAAYQALYVGDTIAGIHRSDAEATEELTRVTAAVGKPVAFAALTADPALTYKRAQILGYKQQPLAQLTFLSQAGAPVALCIMRATAASATGTPDYAERQGLASASWSRDGFEYLLIGGTDRQVIEQAAKRFAAEI
jgi:anti-sigma factor RsiW